MQTATHDVTVDRHFVEVVKRTVQVLGLAPAYFSTLAFPGQEVDREQAGKIATTLTEQATALAVGLEHNGLAEEGELI